MVKMSYFLIKCKVVTEKKNIALLYGGISSEREISLLSGKNVGEALQSRGHKVTFIDTKERDYIEKIKNGNFDIAYVALHGKGGEDGSIQAELDRLGIPYTGSKVQASKNAMNKAIAKEIYRKAKIQTPDSFTVHKNEEYSLDNLTKTTGVDVVVKAVKEGSSLGLYFANGKAEIEKSIEKAFDFDDTVLVERKIQGHEITCAVLDFTDEDAKKLHSKLNFVENSAALPVIEIISKNEFYDFSSKYDEDGSQHICPAKLDENTTKKIQAVAIAAHKSLGCNGFSRTDFLVNDEGEIFALETNTIPGMTSKSLVPDAARAVGISFEDLCEMIINYELNRKSKKTINEKNNPALKYAVSREVAKKEKKKKIIIAAVTIGVCVLSVLGA